MEESGYEESGYIAGPMRGHKRFNFDTFDAVAYRCRTVDGWHVWNPAEHDRETWPDIEQWPGFADGDTATCPAFDIKAAMAWDLTKVAEANHLVLLPGWEQSSGARTERAVAEETGSTIWLANRNAWSGYPGDWYLTRDSVQQRMGPAVIQRRIEDIEALEQVHQQHVDLHVQTARMVTAEEQASVDPRNVNGTTIKTSDTGGQKGAKSVELGRLPQAALRGVAEHFHQGSVKYPDVAPGVANWSLGYDWSLSIEALHRHLSLWESGQDDDPEFGTSHLRAVAFHVLVLMEYEIQGWGNDDRRTPEARRRYLNDQKDQELVDRVLAAQERYGPPDKVPVKVDAPFSGRRVTGDDEVVPLHHRARLGNWWEMAE
jgi:hypothetical protein